SPVLRRHAQVVLERRVRPLERVLELVALEEIVVRPRVVARPVLRIDGTPNRPHGARLALDPDHDPLVRAEIVDAGNDPLREAPLPGVPLHRPEDTIAAMGRLADLLRSPFSFLGTRSSQEDRVAAYVVREHERGRTLAEILDDPYVRNRLTPQQTERLLDRPEIVRAVGDSAIEQTRSTRAAS